MPGLDDLKNFGDDHDDKVDSALEKAGDAAGERVGHEEQIDKGVDALQERTGSGDSTKQE